MVTLGIQGVENGSLDSEHSYSISSTLSSYWCVWEIGLLPFSGLFLVLFCKCCLLDVQRELPPGLSNDMIVLGFRIPSLPTSHRYQTGNSVGKDQRRSDPLDHSLPDSQ